VFDPLRSKRHEKPERNGVFSRPSSGGRAVSILSSARVGQMGIPLVILSRVRVYREGLAMNLASRSPRVEVVGVCGSVAEALKVVKRHPKAAVLIDVGTPEALAAVRRLAAEAPDSMILALALSPDADQEIAAAAEAGIGGYLEPDASLDELLATLEHTARGELLCTPRVAGTLARRLARLSASRSPPEVPVPLTAREMEILELLDAGLSNKQIARRLAIRVSTVKNHVHNILAKLDVRRRGEAASLLREGWAVRGEAEPMLAPTPAMWS
jgi:two-component system, NarL family, nitrate/nitrite response regulator NarL